MYNRYVPGNGGYTRVVVEEDPTHDHVRHRDAARNQQQRSGQGHRHTNPGGGKKSGTPQDLFRNLTAPLGFWGAEENKNAGIAGILKGLHLEDVDSGDLLLLLIILLVFLEGDNTELVITLGLMLLLGLGEEKKGDQNE